MRYTIRTVCRQDMPLLIDLAGQEGWNPGLDDAAAFHAADPQGFFVGELEGRPIACISAVNYGGRYAFVGLYIVRPGYRGQGYGLAIWQHAMTYVGDTVCGLDGVPQQVDNYRRSGFDYAYRQIRYRTHGGAAAQLPAADAAVDVVSPADLDDLLAYDRIAFGVPRDAFLQAWLGMGSAQPLLLRRDGLVCGYAVLRRCLEGFKIGPLFADDPQTAEQLLQACRQRAGDASVYLDVSETHADAMALAARHQMQPVFETARMYRKGRHHFPQARTYGVTTFELG